LAGLPVTDVRDVEGCVSKRTVGLEIFLNGRVLAAYAMRTGHYEYLKPLLRRFVVPLGGRTFRTLQPFLFWPVGGELPGNDRIAYGWDRVVRTYWLDFFGSEDSYLKAACQVEFVLHMNSFLATRVPEVASWLNQYCPRWNLDYWYGSDLWRYGLNSKVALAEKMYEALRQGTDSPFLLDFSVDHTIFQKAFRPAPQGTTGEERPRFIAYLKSLAAWEKEAAFTVSRAPYITDWGTVLEPELEKAK